MLLLLLVLLLTANGTVVPHQSGSGGGGLGSGEMLKRQKEAFEGREGLVLRGVLPEETLQQLSMRALSLQFPAQEVEALRHRYDLPPPSSRGQGVRFPHSPGQMGMLPLCEARMPLSRFLQAAAMAPDKLMGRQCAAHLPSDIHQARLMFDLEDPSPLQSHVLNLIDHEADLLMNRQSTGMDGFELFEIKMLFQPEPYFFPFHYDCCERFVVQLEGHKTIYMYKHDAENLHDFGIFLPSDMPANMTAKMKRFDLEAGDALYIPAHHFHMVEVANRSFTMVLSYSTSEMSSWWGEMLTRCDSDFDNDYPVQAKRNIAEFDAKYSGS